MKRVLNLSEFTGPILNSVRGFENFCECQVSKLALTKKLTRMSIVHPGEFSKIRVITKEFQKIVTRHFPQSGERGIRTTSPDSLQYYVSTKQNIRVTEFSPSHFNSNDNSMNELTT